MRRFTENSIQLFAMDYFYCMFFLYLESQISSVLFKEVDEIGLRVGVRGARSTKGRALRAESFNIPPIGFSRSQGRRYGRIERKFALNTNTYDEW